MTREEFIANITIEGKIPPAHSKERYIMDYYSKEFNELSADYVGSFKHKFRCIIAGFEGRCRVCGEITKWSTTGTWKQYCENHHPQNRTSPVECIADYVDGMSLADVATKHNTSKHLVTKLLKNKSC